MESGDCNVQGGHYGAKLSDDSVYQKLLESIYFTRFFKK